MDKATLRDKLAMAALTGLLAADRERAIAYRPQLWAKESYKWADAMLEVRGANAGQWVQVHPGGKG